MKGSFTVNPCKHGNNNWRIEGRINGKRIRAFFPTKEAAIQAAHNRNRELEYHGHQHTNIPSYLRVEALRAAEILAPFGVSLVDLAQDYRQRHDLRSNSPIVSEACKLFIEDSRRRLDTEEIGFRHHKVSLSTMRKFNVQFSTEHLCDIGNVAIEKWLNGLRKEDGRPLALASKNTHRGSVHLLFSQAEKWGWVKTNPVARVNVLSDRKSRVKQPGILLVGEAAKMLEIADEQILPVIALGLFAGLRQAEINKLTWENILWEKRLIDCSAKITKTASRRFVKMSDNLLEWLAPYRNATGPIFDQCESKMISTVTDTGRAAGIAKWPQNALRHSFGSYYLAMSDNAPETALQMGHSNGETATLMAHYNHRRTQEEALAYWNIRPCQAQNISSISAA